MKITQLTPEQWRAANPRDPNNPDTGWGVYSLYAPEGLWQLATDTGNVVSWNATYLAKGKKADGWGKYANFYLAYTLPEFRKQGLATMLYNHVVENARAAGMFRIKSLVLSKLGYYLHRGLGHKFWGVEIKGELVVDEPLIERAWPDGVPKKARAALNPHIMDQAEIDTWLESKAV